METNLEEAVGSDDTEELLRSIALYLDELAARELARRRKRSPAE